MASQPTLVKLAAATCLALPITAHAFFPFITDDTGTQGRGGNQIELNYEFVKEHNDEVDLEGRVIGSATSVASVMPATYTYGLTDDLDIFVGVARQLNPTRGWLNSEVGLKWVAFGDQSRGWSAALKPTLLIPVTSQMQQRGLGNARTNAGLTLVGSYVADTHELHFNLGYQSNQLGNSPELEPQRHDLWQVSAAPIYVINEQWKAGIDVGLASNPTYDSQYQAFGQVGLQYAPIENLQIGIGIIGTKPINSAQNGWSMALTTGLAYQF